MSEQVSSYISERLDDQISWYGKKSAYNKFRFRICQFIVIVASAVIPIINLGIPLALGNDYPNSPYVALGITAILGGIVTVVTALSTMDAYYQTWILYRTTVETLKRERFLYLNNAADYSSLTPEAKNKLLVERVEAMLSSENSKFLSLQQEAKQQTEQQLNELLQRQREINKQQREELLELRLFREKYERSRIINESGDAELMRSGLAGTNYPIDKSKIQTYFEQNKTKFKDADLVAKIIDKLPADKKYENIEDVLTELNDKDFN